MEDKKPTLHRFWEIDTIRGIAVVLMIFFHLMFDLSFFGAYSGNIYSRPWQVFARSIGSTFIFVLGVSMTLRYSRLKPRLSGWALFKKYLVRGLTLIGWGLVITVVTYFIVGPRLVVFGILHLLGLATILGVPFLRSRWVSLIAGLVVIGVGTQLNSLRVPSPWLIWLGIQQWGRAAVDYYPVFPWFGFALLGIFAGLTFYPGGKPRFRLPDLSQAIPIRGSRFLGRHSLAIYLVHQPILFAILFLLGIATL